MKKLLFLSAAMLQTTFLLAQTPEKHKLNEHQAYLNTTTYQAAAKDGVVRPNRHLFVLVPMPHLQFLFERVGTLLPADMAYRVDKFEK